MNRIKKLRRELDLTQEKLGSRIGVKGNTVAQWESGRNDPPDIAITSICKEFNVNEEWLRYGTGEMFLPDVSDELEALVKRYGLSSADQVLIEKYVNLKEGSRETIINFLTDVVAALNGVDDPNATAFPAGDIYAGIPETPEELEQAFPPLDDPDAKKGGLG